MISSFVGEMPWWFLFLLAYGETQACLFSISACSRFTELAPLAAFLAIRARCRKGTGFFPGRMLGIFHPGNSTRHLYFLSNWGVCFWLDYLKTFIF
jgi:hypothetical protein